MPMILLSVDQLLVNWVAKIEILIKLFLESVEIFHNCLKLPFFGLKIRLLFTDLFRIWFRIRFRSRIRIRIRNVYFGSGSDLDPAKSFGSLRIRFRIRIRNTASPFQLYRRVTELPDFWDSQNLTSSGKPWVRPNKGSRPVQKCWSTLMKL